jgi:hypothetical protein
VRTLLGTACGGPLENPLRETRGRLGHRQGSQRLSQPNLTLMSDGALCALDQVCIQRCFSFRIERVVDVLVQQSIEEMAVHAKVLVA